MGDEHSSKPFSVGVPRIFISGESHGCGTSTVVIGLLAAFKRSGTTVSAGLVGSRLIQATHYRRITGTLIHSLNLWMLDSSQIVETTARLSGGAELVIIEGEQPLFDLYPDDFVCGTEAEVADKVRAPIILVVDARGIGRSIAARVYGYNSFHRGLKVAGIIANRVESPEHDAAIREAIAELNGPVYLGGVPEDERLIGILDSSDPTSPSLLSRGAVVAAGEVVQKQIDLAALRTLAAGAESLEVSRSVVSSRSRICKVAVADDMAFHVTFQANLDLLRREGAELVAFSPVVDRKLPAGVKAVYIPGGYPNLYASELSANQAMHEALRNFVAGGGVLFAEGNSVGYMCRTAMLSSGTKLAMAGIIPGNATLLTDRMTPDRSSFLEIRSAMPTVLTRTGERFRGHRDYQWAVRLEKPVPTAFELDFRPRDDDEESLSSVLEGLCPTPNVLVTSVQPHWGSNPLLARMFLHRAQGGSSDCLADPGKSSFAETVADDVTEAKSQVQEFIGNPNLVEKD